MFSLVTTRFNETTWEENMTFRKKVGYNGCIYASPGPMSPKIEYDSLVFVVEMNNPKNEILGIGLVKNSYRLDKYFKVYETGNYNRYFYKGKYRIDREELIRYNKQLVDVLDQILFKGSTHLKRGSGFTSITEKLLLNNKCEGIDVKETIKNIFLLVFTK